VKENIENDFMKTENGKWENKKKFKKKEEVPDEEIEWYEELLY